MSAKRFITLTFRFIEDEEGKMASICDELGLASYGTDIPTAMKGISEAVSVVLNTLTERGEIGDYLKERGVPISESLETSSKTFNTLTMRPGEWLSTSTRQLELAGA